MKLDKYHDPLGKYLFEYINIYKYTTVLRLIDYYQCFFHDYKYVKLVY